LNFGIWRLVNPLFRGAGVFSTHCRASQVGPKHLIEQEIRNYADFDLLNRIPANLFFSS